MTCDLAGVRVTARHARLGDVEDVRIVVEHDVVAEVSLRIDGQPLLLVAGEVHETMDGGLSFCRFDESVLVFTDPAAANTIPWSPPREHR